jgi:DNA adenine methylase
VPITQLIGAQEMLMDNVPARPAFRYHGSKWLLGKWIIGFFPPHECYVEPFGGGAGVLLQKPRSWLEVYNDKAHQVVNFFRVLRENPDELIRVIELTPYAKEEWEQAFQSDPDPVEMARRFYIRAYMSIAGSTAKWNTGWRRQKMITKVKGQKRMTPAAISFMSVDHLYEVANRFRGVQIECADWQEIIDRYDSPETLFYLDPPYPASTRGRWKKTAYHHEMTDDDHRELAERLRSIRGMAIISGYRCELYDELYRDWKREDKTARVNGPGQATESLWLSTGVVSRWKERFPLFR